MCRLLAYLGPAIPLDTLVLQPAHSLLVQSYQPQEMTAGLLNADGFGLAWYDRARQHTPFFYRNILPIWNDLNLPPLACYVTSTCFLAYIRSATPGLPVDYGNCQPFLSGSLSAIHNGRVVNFRQRLYRPLRRQLNDEDYLAIQGMTDSEHLFAWILHHLRAGRDLCGAIATSFYSLLDLVPDLDVTFNVILSDGERLVASRLAHGGPAPSLYWLAGHPDFPNSCLIASEPLFPDPRWQAVPEGHLIHVHPNRAVELCPVLPLSPECHVAP